MFMNLQFTSCMLIKGPFIRSKNFYFIACFILAIGFGFMPVHCVKVDQCKVICHFFTP